MMKLQCILCQIGFSGFSIVAYHFSLAKQYALEKPIAMVCRGDMGC